MSLLQIKKGNTKIKVFYLLNKINDIIYLKRKINELDREVDKT